jgi:hypothetical protein
MGASCRRVRGRVKKIRAASVTSPLDGTWMGEVAAQRGGRGDPGGSALHPTPSRRCATRRPSPLWDPPGKGAHKTTPFPRRVSRPGPHSSSPFEKAEGSGAPKGSPTVCRACEARRRICEMRPPSGAPLRGSDFWSFRPASAASGHVSWVRGRTHRSCKLRPTGGERPCVLTRALPAPACPSPGKAPPGPVVVPVS